MEKSVLLKLASFVATDGGIYKKRNQVFFDSTDENLINAFVAIAKQAGARKVFINKGHGTTEAYFYSKKISGEILEVLGEKKTLPLEEFLNLPIPDMQEVLRILFTLDGGASLSYNKLNSNKIVRVNRKVTFTSINRKNLLAVQNLLNRFGISSKIYETDLVIKGKENISNFRKHISFIEGSKVTGKSKRWKNLEKNNLLDILLKSYRDTRGV